MFKLKGYKGILFVGDPHLWSKKPGKRLDLNFTSVVLDKLEQAVDIAIRENLYLIILGDLFHSDSDNDIDMLTKLCRIFKKFKEPCASIEGNHEKSQTSLSDDVAISLLRDAEVIRTLEKNGLAIHLVIENKNVLIGTTPYGSKIPQEVKCPEKIEDPFVIWLTHENLDFGESYPGVIQLHEIKGASMLVNGHIHKTKKSKKIGEMVAHNPGNITRLSTDCVDHVPSVWKWTPEQGKDLEPIPLRYQKDVFDLIGKQIEVDLPPSMVQEDMTVKQTSMFVEKMESQMNDDNDKKTDDGDNIKSSIKALGLALHLDNDFITEMMEIAEDTIKTSN